MNPKEEFEARVRKINNTPYRVLLNAIKRTLRRELELDIIRDEYIDRKLTDYIPDKKKSTVINFFIKKAQQIYADQMYLAELRPVAEKYLPYVFSKYTTFSQNNINVKVLDIYKAVYGNRLHWDELGEFMYLNPEHPISLDELNDFYKRYLTEFFEGIKIPQDKYLFIRRDQRGGINWNCYRDHINKDYIANRDRPPNTFLGGDLYGGTMDGYNDVNYHLTFVAPVLQKNIIYVRIGYDRFLNPYGEKNCVVRILSPFVNNQNQDIKNKFENMTCNLIHKQDKPAYINQDFIDKLGKLLRVQIHLYTPYGVYSKKPAVILGAGGNKKHFKMVIQHNHAKLFAPTKVDEVRYIQTVEDHITKIGPQMSTIVELENASNIYWSSLEKSPFAYTRPHNKANLAGFIMVENENLIMYKYLRPSCITGIIADDNNKKLFGCTTPAGVFRFHFIRKHELIAPPEFVFEQAREAGRPFGTTIFQPCKKFCHRAEIDQNASYASFEFSKYYDGFPVGNWMKLAGPPQLDKLLKPAFLEIKSIKPREGVINQQYFDYLTRLRNNFKFITAPEFYRWSEFMEIEVINTTYASFKKISLFEDLNEVESRIREYSDVDNDIKFYIKQLRNKFTGKLIQGGLDTYEEEKIVTTDDFYEMEVIVGEILRDTGVMPMVETIQIGTQSTGWQRYKIHFHIKKAGNKFTNIYSYITAISRLSVMDQIMNLRKINLQVLKVHVDAIYVKKPSKYNYPEFRAYLANHTNISDKPGDFKVTPAEFGEMLGTTAIKPPIFSEGSPQEEGYPLHTKVVITGPGGCGKSTIALNFLRNGGGKVLYLAPTIELRENLRANAKDPKNVICLEKLKQAILRGPTVPYAAEIIANALTFNYIIIDEYPKCDGINVRVIVDFCEKYRINLVMLGDYNQTTFNLSGITCDVPTLNAWGFMLYADPRNARTPDKILRHNYEWGAFLDSIAPLSSASQCEILKKKLGIIRPVEYKIPNASLIYCGTWKQIYNYNTRFVADAADNDLLPLKNIKTGEKVKLMKKDVLPYIFHKREFDEKPSKFHKYTVWYAVTVDCVQGSTIDLDGQYIDVKTLINRRGAIYTAVTRSRQPDQINLIFD